MKVFKPLLVIVSAVLLTGCYTQLEYSQRMSRVTDQKKVDRPTQQQETEYAEYAEEEYVPVYYKDYEYVDRWNDCGCNIYNNYNIHAGYNSSWYGAYDYHYRPHHFRPYYAWSPYYRWSYHRFGHRYYGSSFGFSLHWGHSFYDPYFYDPFYHHYAYGFSPRARNYFIFYGQPGQGYYGGKVGNKGVVDRNRSYRPRTVGTSRVADTNSTRSRNAAVGRQGVTRSKANSTVRTRSAGTTRSRGTVTRSKSSSGSSGRSTGSVTRSRGSSGSSSSSGSRTRSRGGNLQSDTGASQHGEATTRSRNVQRRQNDQRQPQIIRYRGLNSSSSSPRKVESSSQIQNRLRNQTAPKVKTNSSTRSRTTFFDQMKGIIQQGGKKIINSSNRSSTIRLRSRSSNNNSSVTRSKSSGNRSSVTRSRSSSNKSSKSTSSRSRSSRSSSSGSDRSRGN